MYSIKKYIALLGVFLAITGSAEGMRRQRLAGGNCGQSCATPFCLPVGQPIQQNQTEEQNYDTLAAQIASGRVVLTQAEKDMPKTTAQEIRNFYAAVQGRVNQSMQDLVAYMEAFTLGNGDVISAEHKLVYCFVYADPIIADRAAEKIRALVQGGHLDRQLLSYTKDNTEIFHDGTHNYDYLELKPEQIGSLQQMINAVSPYFRAPGVLVWCVPAAALAATGIDCGEACGALASTAAFAAGSSVLHEGLDAAQAMMPSYIPLDVKKITEIITLLPALGCSLGECTEDGYNYAAKPLLIVFCVLVARDAMAYAANTYPVLVLAFCGGCCGLVGQKELAAMFNILALGSYFMSGKKDSKKVSQDKKPTVVKKASTHTGGCC